MIYMIYMIYMMYMYMIYIYIYIYIYITYWAPTVPASQQSGQEEQSRAGSERVRGWLTLIPCSRRNRAHTACVNRPLLPYDRPLLSYDKRGLSYGKSGLLDIYDKRGGKRGLFVRSNRANSACVLTCCVYTACVLTCYITHTHTHTRTHTHTHTHTLHT